VVFSPPAIAFTSPAERSIGARHPGAFSLSASRKPATARSARDAAGSRHGGEFRWPSAPGRRCCRLSPKRRPGRPRALVFFHDLGQNSLAQRASPPGWRTRPYAGVGRGYAEFHVVQKVGQERPFGRLWPRRPTLADPRRATARMRCRCRTSRHVEARLAQLNTRGWSAGRRWFFVPCARRARTDVAALDGVDGVAARRTRQSRRS